MKAWIFFFMPSVSEDTVTVTGVAGAVSWFTVMLRPGRVCLNSLVVDCTVMPLTVSSAFWADRKSTRLNSSHLVISYAVFCLKKKNASIEDVSAYLLRHHITNCRYIRATSTLNLL